MRKYGVDVFTAELLEYNIQDDLDGRERYWIQTLKPEYNMTEGGEGGDTSSSPKYKKAMAEYHSNKPREEYATNGFKGKTWSDEHRKKFSQSKSRACVAEGRRFSSRTEAKAWLKKEGIRASFDRRVKDDRYPDYYMIQD